MRAASPLSAAALLLAQAGLLDGRRATTHWRLLETLKTRYPAVNVEGGPLYIQDGPVWTSGGVSSGFDLTLALVEDDYGFTLARNVAQDMVMYLRRPAASYSSAAINWSSPARPDRLANCKAGSCKTSPQICASKGWPNGSP